MDLQGFEVVTAGKGENKQDVLQFVQIGKPFPI